jgi:hypothetical protein
LLKKLLKQLLSLFTTVREFSMEMASTFEDAFELALSECLDCWKQHRDGLAELPELLDDELDVDGDASRVSTSTTSGRESASAPSGERAVAASSANEGASAP